MTREGERDKDRKSIRGKKERKEENINNVEVLNW